MKILVTGAAGRIGSRVARELLDNGHEVRLLDITAPPADIRDRAEVVYANLTDRLAMLRAVEGCEAIAHLAAIPSPMPEHEFTLVEPNVVGTQYVLAAAEAYGIKRVVLASSCSIYGKAFAKTKFHWDYVPIDEAHPFYLEDFYGLSKQFNELTAEVFTRRSGMATTCMRINYVVHFEGNNWEPLKNRIHNGHNRRSSELWHYIEARDVARAFRLALERVESGHHNVILVSRDILSTQAPRDLLRWHFPELSHHLDSDWDFEKYGFYDSRLAENLFGFVAERSWRDVPELAA